MYRMASFEVSGVEALVSANTGLVSFFFFFPIKVRQSNNRYLDTTEGFVTNKL
jgi:hypothetical protein